MRFPESFSESQFELQVELGHFVLCALMGHAAHVSSICELHLPQSPQQAAYKRQRIRDGENLECRNATARASVTVASYSPRLARPGRCQSLREEEEFVGDTPNPLSVSQWTSKLRSHCSYLVLGELRGPLLLQPSGLQ